MATGYAEDAPRQRIQINSPQDHAEDHILSFVGSVGFRGVVAPMAMLYGDAMSTMYSLRILKDADARTTAPELGREIDHETMEKLHPSVPGELPFTSIASRGQWLHGHRCDGRCRIAVDRNDSCICRFDPHFRQRLFLLAERQIVRDFSKYRSLRYEFSNDTTTMSSPSPLTSSSVPPPMTPLVSKALDDFKQECAATAYC